MLNTGGGSVLSFVSHPRASSSLFLTEGNHNAFNMANHFSSSPQIMTKTQDKEFFLSDLV